MPVAALLWWQDASLTEINYLNNFFKQLNKNAENKSSFKTEILLKSMFMSYLSSMTQVSAFTLKEWQ